MHPTVTLTDLLTMAKHLDDDEERDIIIRAFRLAEQSHEGQKRQSGESFINHPARTAKTLAKHKHGAHVIVAALLHDVVEDTDVTIDDLVSLFGLDIANLVDSVTKVPSNACVTKDESRSRSLAKLRKSMASDTRVAELKIADRLDNMRTLDVMPRRVQLAKAQETLRVYAVLARVLGLEKTCMELESLCYKYLRGIYYPVSAYATIAPLMVNPDKRERYMKVVHAVMRLSYIQGE